MADHRVPGQPPDHDPAGASTSWSPTSGDVGRFAFDTEFVSEETFEPVLCLVQVATRDRLAAIDPLAVRDLAPFWDVVNDPSIEVVMHAASEDLRICRFQTGTVPARVFDVQIAAGLVGFGYPLSLGNLVSPDARGSSVFGGETRTDWRRRPLSPGAAPLRPRRRPLPARPGRPARRRSSPSWAATTWAEAELREFLDGDPEPRRGGPLAAAPGLHQLNRRGLEVARRLGGVAVRGGAAARTGRSASSSATTCSWRSPSGSPRTAATSKRSATSTAPTC